MAFVAGKDSLGTSGTGVRMILPSTNNDKSPSRRLDERAAVALAFALVCAVPSFLISGQVGVGLACGFAGAALGVAVYPVIENRI